VQLGAPAIDIELEACDSFLNGQTVPDTTTLIMSNHNFTFTPSFHELQELEREMREKGAKVAKLATTANTVTDAWTMIKLLQQRTGVLLLPV
jgi:3-dehydroquinate dehydratase type I